MTQPMTHEVWDEVLSARKASTKAWLIIPSAPHRDDGCSVVSYGQLDEMAGWVASRLRAHGERSQLALVVADNSASCCLCIYGAWRAGLTVVPVAPPRRVSRDRGWPATIARVQKDCGAALLIGARSDLAQLGSPPALKTCSFEELLQPLEQLTRSPAARGSELAVLQYTSGTTAGARAVELTHANLVHAVRAIGAFGAREEDVGVCWLPLYHDMGLIGCLLTATYWGLSLVLMQPLTFMLRPESWLWAISRFKATCSVAPSSAYDLCARMISDAKLEGMDLSSLRVAFNGAELIQPGTLTRFADRFRGYGFNPRAMRPVYGLAESAVVGTLWDYDREPSVDWVDGERLEREGAACPARAGGRTRGVVCVGSAGEGMRVRIWDARSEALAADRRVGEIQLSGPCAARTYYRRDPSDLITPDGWLRTGDRGYLDEGRLYVVGRTKHIVKRYGRTLDAAWLEQMVRTIPEIRGGIVAVFGVPSPSSGSEQLVVMAEMRAGASAASRERVRIEIADLLRRETGLTPDEIAIVPSGTIPRTSSGKVRHAEAQRMLAASAR
jgi:acyl-CoA synthetase (AMP-forming)/AMP-acid ligase II